MLTNKRKLMLAIVVNFIIVLLEIIGAILSIKRHGVRAFQYYTEDSNYFALIISFIFVLCGIISLTTNKSLGGVIHILRFISTTCLTVTLIVVLLVLIPMFPEDSVFMLFGNSNLYQHTLCPILSVLSFVFLENEIRLSKRSIFISLIPTIVYGVICISLNICRVMEGPYPFFYVYEFPWYFSTIFLLSIFGGAILISFILYSLHNGRRKYL